MYVVFLMVAIVFLLFCIVCLLNFKWCIDTIRDICNSKGGYTKFVQIIFVFILISIFLGILSYYVIRPDKVNKVDVILTVVVGWLGAIIGSFFSETSMQGIEQDRDKKRIVGIMAKKKMRRYVNKIDEIVHQLGEKEK